MINLVSPEIKRRKGVRSLTYILALCYIVSTSTLLLGLAGLATYNYTTKVSLADQQAELERLKTDEEGDKILLDQAAFVQSRVKNAALYQSSDNWSQVLTAIAQSTPTNSHLISIKVSGGEEKPPVIAISGETTDRRSIILFKDKLSVTKPLSGASITSITESSGSDSKLYTFAISVGITKGGK